MFRHESKYQTRVKAQQSRLDSGPKFTSIKMSPVATKETTSTVTVARVITKRLVKQFFFISVAATKFIS